MLLQRDLFPASREWGRMKEVPLQRAGAARALVEMGGAASRGPLATLQATASAAVVCAPLEYSSVCPAI